MIKRTNNKKKKGFTLIELIIVLAVMAIIALIAIPNFAAVRNNSKVKADQQSCATIERTVLMLVSDETISLENANTDGTIEFVPGTATVTGITGGDTKNNEGAQKVIKEALEQVKAPQAAPDFKKDGDKANAYKITIYKDGKVTAKTIAATTTP